VSPKWGGQKKFEKSRGKCVGTKKKSVTEMCSLISRGTYVVSISETENSALPLGGPLSMEFVMLKLKQFLLLLNSGEVQR